MPAPEPALTSREEPRTPATDSPEAFVAAIADEDCRGMLAAASEDALTAGELADTCDIGLSTAYRKVNRLVDLGLFEKRVRIAEPGQFTREYRTRVRRLSVTLSPEDGLDVAAELVGHPADAADHPGQQSAHGD
jgi:hypothetical protein